MDPVKQLRVRVQLEILITERETMIAANQESLAANDQVSYTEADFYTLTQKLEKLMEELC